MAIMSAIQDQEPFYKYHEVREKITKDLALPNKPKVEMFTVDIIKAIVKSKVSEKEKFIALCLLKDLLKTKEVRLVNYNSKKILSWLYTLANSSLKG